MNKRLLVFLSIFFLTTSAFAQPDDKGLKKVRISSFEGGRNSFDLSEVIEPNQATIVKNVVLSRKGLLSTRKGQALFGFDASNTAFTGLGTFYPDVTTNYIVVASGVTVSTSTTSEGNWVVRNPANTLTTGKDTEFLQANKLLAVFNGSNNTAFWDGLTWDPGATSTASPPICTTAAWQLNYFFCAGNPTNPDWVYFSNNLDPQTFTSTDLVKVSSGDGQRIIRLEPFRENELVAYKERSIYIIDLSGDTVPDDWSIQPITTAVGCAAARSVVNVGNDHWFLSSVPFAVRSLVRTSFDKVLTEMRSQNIQDIFDGTGDVTINKAEIDKACAILFDDKYILALSTGSSTVNNLVVVYDFITNSWYTIENWFPAAWIKYNNNLYYIDNADGRVIQCFTGTQGDMASGPVVTTTAEPVTPIEFEYASGDLDFDNPENFKHPDALEVEFDPTGSWSATVSINLDNSGWQTVGTINLAGEAPTLPIALPFTLGSEGYARETFHLQEYGEFRQIRVRITQSGLSQTVKFKRATVFARIKPWRRK